MSRFKRPARFRLPATLMATCGALLALFVVPAFAQASPAWYYNGALLSGSKEVTSTNAGLGSFKLTGTLSGFPVELVCSEETDHGTITAPNTDNVTINWAGCSAEEPFGACAVNVEETHAKTELFFNAKGELFDRFKPEVAGSPFTFINIAGCALAGHWPVEGDTAAFDKESGVEKATHILEFSAAIEAASGTGLVFAGEPASLEGRSAVTLVGTGTFSAH